MGFFCVSSNSEIIVHGIIITSVFSDALSSSADHSSSIPQVMIQQIITSRLLNLFYVYISIGEPGDKAK